MSYITSIADRITQWSLLGLMALVPVFVVPLPWFTVPQGKLLFIGVLALTAFAAWLVSRWLHGSLVLPRHLTLWGSALLPVVFLLSAVFSGNGWASFASGTASADTVVVVAIWYLLLALVAIVYAQGRYSFEPLVRALAAGLIVLFAFQTLRVFFPGFTSLGGFLSGNASSIFGSWHDLGIVAGLGVFLSLALWRSSVASSALWRGMLATLGVLSLFVTVVVNTIDVWYALAIVALLWGMWQLFALWRAGHSLKKGLLSKGVVIWLVLAAAAAACAVWSPAFYSKLPAQMQVAQLEVRPSWQGTYMIGEKALSGKKALLFGSGPNSFVRDWSLFKPAGVNVTDYWNVDFTAGIGFVPTTFVTTGILGILAWLLFALSVLWSLMRALMGRSTMHGLLPAVLGAALYLFAFHITYVPGVALSALLFLLVGLVVALESAEQGARSRNISLRPERAAAYAPVAVAGLVALFLVLSPVIAVRAIVSDLYVQKAVVAYNKDGGLEKPLAYVKRSLMIFPDNDLAHRAAVQIGLLQLQQIINSGAQDEATRTALQNKLQETISYGLSAVSIDSDDYQNWMSLAALYQNLAGVGIAGAYDNAKQAYQKAAEDNPTNPLPHAQLAQLALSQGDTSMALYELDKAIELKPNLGVAYYLRSQIHASASDFDAATNDAVAAAQLAQQDPLAWYNLGAVLYAAAKYDLATQALAQAVSLQNNYANALFLLGLSLDKAGQREQALAAMLEVQKLNPEDASIAQILENLQNGKSAVPQ